MTERLLAFISSAARRYDRLFCRVRLDYQAKATHLALLAVL